MNIIYTSTKHQVLPLQSSLKKKGLLVLKFIAYSISHLLYEKTVHCLLKTTK